MPKPNANSLLEGTYSWWQHGFLEVTVDADGRGFAVPPTVLPPGEPPPPTPYRTATVFAGFRPAQKYKASLTTVDDDFFTTAGYYPFTIMGIVRFDGAGNFDGTGRSCIGGVSRPFRADQPANGTYSVDPAGLQGLITTRFTLSGVKQISSDQFFVVRRFGQNVIEELEIMDTYSDVRDHRRSIMLGTMMRLSGKASKSGRSLKRRGR